jgi:23S rRNA pseudouridine2457 synthase
MVQKLIALNKPYEVLCQFTDASSRKTLKDFIKIPGIYAAGRLDYRSEGLILLTNQGALIHRLTDPLYEHPKTYLVQVEGYITSDVVEILNRDLVLPGIQKKLAKAASILPPELPARGKAVRDLHPTSWLQITLKEGKKHQVRRMTAAVGFPTLRLVRVSIGPISLGNLSPGEWRWLTDQEISSLWRSEKSSI